MTPEEIKTKKKSFLIIFIVGCVAVAIISFYLGSYWKQKTYGFGKGTVIETSNSLPDDFPTGIIPEENFVKSASVIKYQNGRKDINALYLSFKQMPQLIKEYGQRLKDNGWDVKTQEQLSSSGVVSAIKDKEEMSITFIPKASAVEVNFLYIKK